MRLEEAVKLSSVNAAFRPYYSKEMDPLRQKCIVVIGHYQDMYKVWADTFDYIGPLDEMDNHKIRGVIDWAPVAPKANNG